VVIWPGESLATIVHGAPEGLYTHQLGHLLFLGAMLYIWWVTRHRPRKSWHFIRMSFLLFALWNLDTFLVHVLDALIPRSQYVGLAKDWSLRFQANGLFDLVSYAGKQDHLLSVPAAVCLYYGLRLLRHEKVREGKS